MSRKLFAVFSLSALLLSGCSAIPTETPTDREITSTIETPSIQTKVPKSDQKELPQITKAQKELPQVTKAELPQIELTATTKAKIKPGPKLNGPKALTVLNSLPVKGKAPGTGYNRNAKFGNGWKDFNNNLCDERQDALKRDMSKVKYKDKKKCAVASGTLHDSYAGKTINWKIGAGSVDIDHAVALKNAWISGAQGLSQAQRQALSNDPLNLIASDASSNRQKGDKNTAEWLPKNKGFRCQYVATQVSVKKKYALSVTAPEKAAMKKVLNTCKNQKAAKVTPIKPAGKAPAAKPSTPKKAAPKKSNSGTVSGTVYPGSYCKAADKGKKGKSKAGKTYTCKNDSSGKPRWRV
jgi:hypothetical protein